MGVRILVGSETGGDKEVAVLFCSTSEVAFGPLMDGDSFGDPYFEAEWFLKYLAHDAREYDDADLITEHMRYLQVVDSIKEQLTACCDVHPEYAPEYESDWSCPNCNSEYDPK